MRKKKKNGERNGVTETDRDEDGDQDRDMDGEKDRDEDRDKDKDRDEDSDKGREENGETEGTGSSARVIDWKRRELGVEVKGGSAKRETETRSIIE